MIWIKYLFPVAGFFGTAIGIGLGNYKVTISIFVPILIASLLFFALRDVKLKKEGVSIFTLFILMFIPGSIFFIVDTGRWDIPIIQFSMVSLLSISIWIYFKFLDFDFEKIFNAYLKLALIASSVGVIQQLAYFADLNFVFDMRWLFFNSADLTFNGNFLRVVSVFTEPSYFSYFLIPAVYFSIASIFFKDQTLSLYQAIIIILALVLTFSSVGYLGLLAAFLFQVRFSVKRSIYLFIVLFITMFLMLYSDSFLLRISGIIDIYINGLTEKVNLSSFILGLNSILALEIFSDYPFVGIGLGGARFYTLEYLNNFIANNYALEDHILRLEGSLMLADMGNMYLKLMVESGVFGMAILMWMLFKYKLSYIESFHAKNIAKASSLFVVIFSLRSGQMIRFELIYFIILYFMIVKKYYLYHKRPTKNKELK